MLDLTGIMFTTIAILIVLVRAIKLDRTLPWFETARDASQRALDELKEQAARSGTAWRQPNP